MHLAAGRNSPDHRMHLIVLPGSMANLACSPFREDLRYKHPRRNTSSSVLGLFYLTLLSGCWYFFLKTLLVKFTVTILWFEIILPCIKIINNKKRIFLFLLTLIYCHYLMIWNNFTMHKKYKQQKEDFFFFY